MRFSPGQTGARLEAVFTNSAGALIDPDQLQVDVYDSNDVRIIDNGVAVRVSLGTYSFTFDLSDSAPVGIWRIEWLAIVDGLNAVGDESFEVLASDVSVSPSDQINGSRLRSRLAEVKTDPDGDGSETFFTDSAISDLLVYASNDLNVATLEGWKRKAAHLSRLVDISESGSERKLSQRFRQAQQMVQFWSSVAGNDAEIRSAALAGRVVGRVISLRCDDDSGSPYPFFDGENIREYPTHRLIIPAILG